MIWGNVSDGKLDKITENRQLIWFDIIMNHD